MNTLADIGNLKGSSNAITRWAKFGPYYAMFPIDFAFDVITQYSNKGDYVIDPFAGRFSSIFAGGALDRHSTGIEINPVGWLYGKTKLNPAPKRNVQTKLAEIYLQRNDYQKQADELPEFFQICYCNEVLKFLLAAKELLIWRRRKTDATLMSIILVSLHGKIGEGLSNQLRQTKAMGAIYSVNWWKKNNFEIPPEINPFEFLTKKIEWRYKKDVPKIKTTCKALLGDSTKRLKEVVSEANKNNIKYSLLFTSPPYQDVVDYHADQWIRLWLLDQEINNQHIYKRRFSSKDDYKKLLNSVFENCAKIMSKKSTIFVRTDIREFTYDSTIEILKTHFPKHKLEVSESIVVKKNQTELFNNKSMKKEVDIKLIKNS